MSRSVAPFLLAACLLGCASDRKNSEPPETMVPPPEPAPATTNEPAGLPPTPDDTKVPPASSHLEKSLEAPPPKNDGGIGSAGAGAMAGMGGTAPTGGGGGSRGIGDRKKH
jgi:hypothetical protein